MSFPYKFEAPNTRAKYTVVERWVQVGVMKFAKNPVYDLVSSATGRYTTHDEAGLINALAVRLEVPHAKAARAFKRMQSPDYEKFNLYSNYNAYSVTN